MAASEFWRSTPFIVEIAFEAAAQKRKASQERDRHQAWCIGMLSQASKLPPHDEWVHPPSAEQSARVREEQLILAVRAHNEHIKKGA